MLSHRLAAPLVFFALVWSGCAEHAEHPALEAEARVEASRAEGVQHHALARFEGAFDPATGELTITMLQGSEADGLRELEVPLWRRVRVSRGARDTVTLRNGAAGVNVTPANCGVTGNVIVNTLGMLCVPVQLRSYFETETLLDTYAMITRISPDTGYNGYGPDFGGADPSLVYPGPNAPTDAGGGLWYYGDVAPGEMQEVTWYMHNAGGAFRFSGEVRAAFPELRNGRDDNGDGAIDEAPFADGETCTDASECYGGYCEAGLCASAPSSCPSDTWGPTCTPCACDDGIFCNGEETCDPVTGACGAGAAPNLDDGDPCTTGTCDEVNDTVVHTPLPNGSIHASRGALSAIRVDGRVVSWGASDEGGSQDVPSPVSSWLTDSVIDVVGNFEGAFSAVRSDGRVVSWGNSNHRYGGHGPDPAILSGAVSLSATQTAFAAIMDDGSVETWNDPDGGGVQSWPFDVSAELSSGVVRLVPGEAVFAALKEDGSVVTWGDPWEGGRQDWPFDVSAELSSGVEDIFASGSSFAALKAGGQLVVWGDDNRGGDASAVASELTSGVVDVIPGGGAFAALKSDGSLVVWGAEWAGGDASAVASELTSGVVDVVSNGAAFVALKDDDSVVVWGESEWGGDASSVAADLATGVAEVFEGPGGFAALLNDGRLVTWGVPENGGDSSSVASEISSGVVSVHHTGFAYAVLKDDGSVVSWGDIAPAPSSLSIRRVVELFAGTYAFAAVTEDGSVFTWGSANAGGDSSSVASLLGPGALRCVTPP